MIRLAAGLMLFPFATAALADLPAVPCAGAQVAFPPVAAEPVIRIFKKPALANWTPPSCTGWPSGPFEFVGTAAASFRHDGDALELVRRYGAISGYAAMRYFSPRRQAWRELFFDAFALRDVNPTSRRGDFSIAELSPGVVRYFWQRGANEAPPPLPSTTDLVYRMEVFARTPDRLVIAVTSEPGSVAVVMRLARGDIRILYFMERDLATPDTWRYFALTSLSGVAALGADDFYRASTRGVFRHTAGLPAEVKAP